MQLHELVNTIGQDLQRRYGEKVHKLTLHGGFSCPNRDGTIGRGGCTFVTLRRLQTKRLKSKVLQLNSTIERAKLHELKSISLIFRRTPVPMQKFRC